jgi:NTE family protein
MSGGTALVLSGGGAPAAYFGAGVIQALEEAGERPTILSGVSAGSINACAVGAGMDAATLTKMWCNIRWTDIYRPRMDVWRAINVGRLLRPTTNIAEYALGAIGWTWLLDTAPARKTLTSYLGGAEIAPPAGTTVVVSAVDENSGDVVRFCSDLPPRHRRDPQFRQVDLTVDHVLASAAVPLLFPPGRDSGTSPRTEPAARAAASQAAASQAATSQGGASGGGLFGVFDSHGDGHSLVDAGLVANTPLAPAMRYEPDRVIVVSGAGITRPAPTPDSLGAAIALLVDNVAHFALTADVDHANTVNRLVAAAPETTVKRNVPILMIEPTDLGFSLNGFLHFTPAQARAVIEYGREQAGKAFAGWSP